MSTLFDDSAEERAAAEYVAAQYRLDEVRDNAELLCQAVWDNLVSAAVAIHIGQDADSQAAADRAFEDIRFAAEQDMDVVIHALVCGVWPHALAAAKEQLKQLRDFHYIDRDSGLIPVPPHGRHRAEED